MIAKRPQEESSSIGEGSWKGQNLRYRKGRIVVKLKKHSGESAQALQATLEKISRDVGQATLIRSPGATGRMVLQLPPQSDVLAAAERLARHADVEWAEPDVVDSAAVVPSDPRFGDQWGLTMVSAPTAWDLQTGSAAKVLIGVIDSGISMTATGTLDHPDLDDAARFLLGTDFVDGGTPRDLNGHGTHVAGIAEAESNNATGVSGACWGCHVYVCRTLDAAGNGSGADFASAVEEIVDYAVAHGLKAVINYSGGGAASNAKKDACKYADDHGMILCAAAGNDYGGAVIFPAAYSTMFDGVIAVGSTTATDTVSDFSNVGPEINVVAPGSSILSTTPTYAAGLGAALNYDYLSGTSMATPLVTGIVALMWSRHPGFSNKHIRDCLQDSAKKLSATATFDNAWGHGRVNAREALTCGDLHFTQFTRFTRITRFTEFTRFTLGPFTKLTPFTKFTNFTFPPFTRFTGDPPPWGRVDPFIRFGNTVFSPSELQLERFQELAPIVSPLRAAGLVAVHQLAQATPEELANAARLQPEDAASAIRAAQEIMHRLAHEPHGERA